MKKIIIFVLTVLLFNGLHINNALAIDGSPDARCTAVDQSGYKEVGLEAPDEQTFVPTYDRFTGVDIIVGGHMWGVDGINFTLYNSVGAVVGTGSIAPTINGGPTVRSWTVVNPISVRKGVTYRFRVENPNKADFVWYATGDNNCYTAGNARQNNTNKLFDFGFTTYGFDATTPTPTATVSDVPENEPTPEANQSQQTANTNSESESNLSNISLNEGSSTGTGDAPSANISNSIIAPTELELSQVNISNKPVLQSKWTASKTTDIDGYKVFRSDKEKTDYKNIAKVDKKITEYKDAEVEAGKTYYYQIRAYKGSLESKSSNTEWRKVEAIAVPSVTPAIAISQVASIPITTNGSSDVIWWLWWSIIVLVLLIILTLLLYKEKKWPFKKAIDQINTDSLS